MSVCSIPSVAVIGPYLLEIENRLLRRPTEGDRARVVLAVQGIIRYGVAAPRPASQSRSKLSTTVLTSQHAGLTAERRMQPTQVNVDVDLWCALSFDAAGPSPAAKGTSPYRLPARHSPHNGAPCGGALRAGQTKPAGPPYRAGGSADGADPMRRHRVWNHRSESVDRQRFLLPPSRTNPGRRASPAVVRVGVEDRLARITGGAHPFGQAGARQPPHHPAGRRDRVQVAERQLRDALLDCALQLVTPDDT